jgi:hypothetical protein
LQCLAKVFDDDCKASNYSFDPQVVDGGSKHLYRAKGSILVNDQWSDLVADCAHNLRSALDHLACQLVIANGHSPTSRTSCCRPRSLHMSRRRSVRMGRPGSVMTVVLGLS